MGDANTILIAAEARQLLRRTGFEARPADVTKLVGESRGDAVDGILNFKPARFKPRGPYLDIVRNSWIRYMVKARHPIQEKLVLFWHDHFATGDSKVNDHILMARQNQLLRRFCKGNFRDFVKAINKDAAMMEYLDTVRNHRSQPNENYGRELQELFTLGVRDFAGNANYSQEDVVQIARAFSGWSYYWKNGKPEFDPYDHNTVDDGGPKIIYTDHGNFAPGGVDYTQPQGEGPEEIDRIIDVILEHRDTDNHVTAARFIARKLLYYFAYDGVADAVVDEVITTSGFDVSWELSDLLRAIFVHDVFYETAVPAPFGAGTVKSMKWPVDYVVGTLRLLGMRLKSKYQYIPGGDTAADHLDNMGQTLLDPPSVFGWDWELAWLSSSTMLARCSFARDVVHARYGGGRTQFRPDHLIDLSLTHAAPIVDAVLEALSMTDELDASERDALIDYLSDGNPGALLDLHDYDTRNRKLHGLFGLVLQSPAYQLH